MWHQRLHGPGGHAVARVRHVRGLLGLRRPRLRDARGIRSFPGQDGLAAPPADPHRGLTVQGRVPAPRQGPGEQAVRRGHQPTARHALRRRRRHQATRVFSRAREGGLGGSGAARGDAAAHAGDPSRGGHDAG